ncbi:hypothetical protein AAKU67_003480 [Oxalobacteraceae bacterium GrIS 2.11]
MKTLHSVQTLQAKLILGTALIIAVSAISFAFQQADNAKFNGVPLAQTEVQQVVIHGQRMSAEEKLIYDLVPQEIARVEIIGKRLGADEKMAMIAEDESAAKRTVAHRKA